MATAVLPIAVFHEHPDWFRPLFAELERRDIPFVRLDAASHAFDPSEQHALYSLVVNRASPSAYLRGHGQSAQVSGSGQVLPADVRGPDRHDLRRDRDGALEVASCEMNHGALRRKGLFLERAALPDEVTSCFTGAV